MDYKPGIYEAKKYVLIRREPRIVEIRLPGGAYVHNRVGAIDAGTRREMKSFVTDKNNMTWGNVSESDPSGISQWICIRTVNTVFMEAVDGGVVVPPSGSVEARLSNLEAWARTKGYLG